jgi:hypothetical protein
MARAALKMPPTVALHAGSYGLLPVYCIDQLMVRRMYVRCTVDPGPWLLSQIARVHPLLEVHPALVSLVIAAAVAAVEPLGTPRCGLNQPPRMDEQVEFAKCLPLPLWPTHAIAKVQRQACKPAWALLSLYVLTVNDVRRARLARGGEPMFTVPRMEAPMPDGYSSEFIDELQLAKLLYEIRAADFAEGAAKQPWITELRAPLEALILAERPQFQDARLSLLRLTVGMAAGDRRQGSEGGAPDRLEHAIAVVEKASHEPGGSSTSWLLSSVFDSVAENLRQAAASHQTKIFADGAWQSFWSKVWGSSED